MKTAIRHHGVRAPMDRLFIPVTLVFVIALAAVSFGQTERVLYNFQGAGDGSNPASTLVKDAHGNLLRHEPARGDF
jgi:hypothetical protein